MSHSLEHLPANVRQARRSLVMGACAMGLALLAGCDAEPRASVTGRITRKDGTPVVGALILARSDTTGKSASGQTDGEGRYTLGVAQMGDGIPPGDYAVIITEERMGMDGGGKRTINPKYGNFTQSGLTLSVADGEAKDFNVEVDPL